jgi:hypothetical protein
MAKLALACPRDLRPRPSRHAPTRGNIADWTGQTGNGPEALRLFQTRPLPKRHDPPMSGRSREFGGI